MGTDGALSPFTYQAALDNSVRNVGVIRWVCEQTQYIAYRS